MKIIASIQNKEIRAVGKLNTSKGRENQNRFIVEGIRACETLILAKKLRPIQIYVLQTSNEAAKKFVSPNMITLVSDQVMGKMSGAETPSGVLGVFEIPTKPKLDKLSSGLVMAQISDPGNMGTLIRTATAMAYETVVIVEGCDPWAPKVVQSSAGTIGLVNIFQLSWQELLDNKKDLNLAALVVSGGDKPNALKKNSLIVVGNEAHGMPEEWVQNCTQKITLEMPGQTESLNVAVAGSIALYLSKGN